jgi:hypothetical protein
MGGDLLASTRQHSRFLILINLMRWSCDAAFVTTQEHLRTNLNDHGMLHVQEGQGQMAGNPGEITVRSSHEEMLEASGQSTYHRIHHCQSGILESPDHEDDMMVLLD